MQAKAYNRTKNFAENNSDRTDHSALNTELDNVALSINGLRSNLDLIQKDDGSLEDAIVGIENLTEEAIFALRVPGEQGVQGVQGERGERGDQGLKGDIGPSFDSDAKDLLSNRYLYNLQPKGFSFLAIDTGYLYFKVSGVSGDWSPGFTYGKGDKGDQGLKGDKGDQGIQGLQGNKGDKGDQGPPGSNGVNSAVTSIDASTKTASLVGRSNVSARLAINSGVLTIILSTS